MVEVKLDVVGRKVGVEIVGIELVVAVGGRGGLIFVFETKTVFADFV